MNEFVPSGQLLARWHVDHHAIENGLPSASVRLGFPALPGAFSEKGIWCSGRLWKIAAVAARRHPAHTDTRAQAGPDALERTAKLALSAR